MANRTVILPRLVIEDTIEQLISLLDEADGDTDLEDDELEEPHDAEADLTWSNGTAPGFYLIAEAARRRGRFGQ